MVEYKNLIPKKFRPLLHAFIFVFSNCSSGGGLKSSTCTWSRSVRRRGHNLDLVVAHGDGLSDLEVFNTIDDCWTSLATLPEHCGLDGVAIIGFRSKVRIKPSLNKTIGKKFSSNGVLWFEKVHILVQDYCTVGLIFF